MTKYETEEITTEKRTRYKCDFCGQKGMAKEDISTLIINPKVMESRRMVEDTIKCHLPVDRYISLAPNTEYYFDEDESMDICKYCRNALFGDNNV